MDLWTPYRHTVQRYMPKAKIVADAFRVLVLINRILDNKRSQVIKRYIIENDVINSFQKHDNIRYSNGRLEGKNRAIKTIIRNAYGYKNFERFRARVLYSINKDVPLKLSK